MKIKYEKFNFSAGFVEERERDINSKEVLAGNAFFQMLRKEAAKPPGPDMTHEPTAKLFRSSRGPS